MLQEPEKKTTLYGQQYSNHKPLPGSVLALGVATLCVIFLAIGAFALEHAKGQPKNNTARAELTQP